MGRRDPLFLHLGDSVKGAHLSRRVQMDDEHVGTSWVDHHV